MNGRAVAATILLAVAAGSAAQERRSGFDFMSSETQAMQLDDMANPGMFAVADGAALWSAPAGADNRACADCHGADAGAMVGVAARYPAFDGPSGEPVDLEGRINLCRVRHQGAPALERESGALVALTTFVANKSRGLPVAPDPDPRMDELRAEGRVLWQTRIGQLNLSCANCHDEHWGGRLAGSLIPQGHPTGYPIYRLEWQEMGSLQRRLRGCFVGVRSTPPVPGSREAVALEAYLMERAEGMAMETPAIRP